MLVVQGVGLNSVFIYADQHEFDSVRQYLMKGNTYTCNVVYPEIFHRKYQLTYIQNNYTTPFNIDIMMSKVIFGS